MICGWLARAGAAQTPAVHRGVLPAHGRQDGGGGARRLAHQGADPHQSQQVHRVRPEPHGEDRVREAGQPGAPSGDRPDLPAPLPRGLPVPDRWTVSLPSLLPPEAYSL